MRTAVARAMSRAVATCWLRPPMTRISGSALVVIWTCIASAASNSMPCTPAQTAALMPLGGRIWRQCSISASSRPRIAWTSLAATKSRQ